MLINIGWTWPINKLTWDFNSIYNRRWWPRSRRLAAGRVWTCRFCWIISICRSFRCIGPVGSFWTVWRPTSRPRLWPRSRPSRSRLWRMSCWATSLTTPWRITYFPTTWCVWIWWTNCFLRSHWIFRWLRSSTSNTWSWAPRIHWLWRRLFRFIGFWTSWFFVAWTTRSSRNWTFRFFMTSWSGMRTSTWCRTIWFMADRAIASRFTGCLSLFGIAFFISTTRSRSNFFLNAAWISTLSRIAGVWTTTTICN